MEKPTGSPSVGAKEKLEKQARQLAYDTRYAVRKSMNKGTKLNPAQVAKAYQAQLSASRAAAARRGNRALSPAVVARAKQMLLGEDLVDTKRLATDTVVSALYKVFVEGVEDKIVQESAHQLDEMEEKKYKIRVTDKKTGNTYRTMATRAKIAELRANPNIISVEMTKHGEISKSEGESGSSTASVKAGKGLDPVGQEDSDPDNDRKHNDPNDKYIMKRRKAIGKAINTRKEDYNWQDGFAELIEKKKEEKKEKITGEGVDNTRLIKVFPDDRNGIKEQVKPDEQIKPTQQKPQPQKIEKDIVDPNEKRQISTLQQFQNKERQLNQQILSSQKAGKIPVGSVQMNSYEPEGDSIDEKITATTDMGTAIKDFYGSKSSQLAGRTKKERRKAAIAAVLTARRGGRKLGEECECEDEEPQVTNNQDSVEDPREIPTKVNLVKNKLRAMGLKMSYEPEGEVVSEGPEDGVNDERLMRGGVGAGRGGSRPTLKPQTPKERKAAMEKHQETSRKAVSAVRASIEAKYGKDALM